MIARGDRHHDIAAWFGVNQRRIAEVNGGAIYADVPSAPAQSLPPPGPYSSGRPAHRAISTLEDAKLALDQAEVTVHDALKEIRRGRL
jgi:hypothetical protein